LVPPAIVGVVATMLVPTSLVSTLVAVALVSTVPYSPTDA
jgi:hypothetical protein